MTASSPVRTSFAVVASLLLLAAGLWGGCQQRFDRAAMLQDLARNVIVPTYTAFAARTDTLAARTAAFRDRPSPATLDAARQAWQAASTTWKEAQAFELGPVQTKRLNSRINFWPTRPETIERALAEDGAAERVDQLSVAARGLPAIEYLLFDATEQAPTGADLLEESEEAARRRALAAALARDVAENAQALLTAWRPEGEHFAAAWGQGEGPMDGPQEAITMLVNRLIFLLEDIRHEKLGAPLGKDNGGTPQPQAAEAWRSGTSRAQLRHSLIGLAHVYHGRTDSTQGMGLKDYLQTLDAALADTLGAQIERTQRTVEAIPDPLHAAVTDAPAPVEEAYEETGTLLRLVEVDATNVLGVTLLFNDNDGD